MRLLSTWLLVAVAQSTPAPAQTVRVRAVEDGSSARLPGVVVTLRAESGQPVYRQLADEFGLAVVLHVPPGRYRLSGGRIGYDAPAPQTIVVGSADPGEIRLVMPPTRVNLPELTTTSTRKVVCRLGSESGNLMAALWGEVQKMLWEAELTREAPAARFDILTYQRNLNLDGRVTSERTAMRSSSHERPFVTEDPEALARDGFIRRDDSGVTYFAPDARLLLADAFTRDHCFEVVPGTGETNGLIGLAFKPAPNRNVPDVRGTLWINHESAALESLDYGYVNTGVAALGSTGGGRLEFHHFPALGWVMHRWSIRVPAVVTVIGADARPGMRTTRDSVIGFRESGGEARPGAGQSQNTGTGVSLEGVVFDSVTGRPLAGATVSVAGGAYRSITDSLGRFSLAPAAPGDYLVSIEHDRFRWLGLGSVRRSARLVRGDPARLDIALPSEATILRSLCPALPPADQSLGLVVGRLPDRPAGEVSIDLSWPLQPIRRTGERVTVRERGASVTVPVGPDGGYHACGVPRNVPVDARVLVKGTELIRVTFEFGPGRIAEQVIGALSPPR